MLLTGVLDDPAARARTDRGALGDRRLFSPPACAVSLKIVEPVHNPVVSLSREKATAGHDHSDWDGTRKRSNASIIQTWSVSPADMAGVTDFHFFSDPLPSLAGQRACQALPQATMRDNEVVVRKRKRALMFRTVSGFREGMHLPSHPAFI